MDEREIFEGSENTLTMNQTYTHEFQCIFDLRNYPFDRQTCSIEMAASNLDAPTMRLIPKELWMEQNADMNLFVMRGWDFGYKEKGLRMNIFLERKIMSEMLTTYLPSFLLLMITFATTFFKPFFFEAARTVNLTNMLVMTTIFISVMEKLPLTSYPKMIDFWLIFCQLVPFAEVIFIFIYCIHLHIVQVILLTAMEYMREEADEKEKESTKTQTRWQKRSWTGNWAGRIKTFGEKNIQLKSRKMLLHDIFCF